MNIKWTLYIATFISTIGDGMFYIATAWYVYQKMQTSLAVGFLLAFSLLPVIIVVPYTGHVADRYNRKKIAVIMDIIRFLVILVSGFLFLSKENVVSVIGIYLLTALVKIADCFFAPCITSLIKINFNDKEYMKIFSVNNTLQQIGTIMGSVVTGLLLSKINIAYILFFDAVTFLFSAIVILNLEKNVVVELGDTSRNVAQGFKEGLDYILNKKAIIFLMVICGAPNLVVNILNTLLCEYTEIVLGLSVEEYSILDASFGIGCACMGALISFFLSKIKENGLGLIGYMLIPVSLFSLSLTRSFYISLIEIIALGALVMIISINSKTLFAKIVDKEYVGRVDSYTYTINSVIVSLSGIFAGFLSGITSISWVFSVYSLICIVFVICHVLLINRLHESN